MWYVRCDSCGELIEEGSDVYVMYDRSNGIYCSPECLCTAWALKENLTEQLAESKSCTGIYKSLSL